MTQTPSHSSGNIGAGGDVAGSILVSGSHNVVTLSAVQAAQTPELRRYLRMLTVIASPIADETQRKPPASPPLDHYEQARERFIAVGSRLGEANTLAGMGRVALLQDDQEKADSVLKEAIAIYNAIGDRYSVPAQIGNYGWTLHRMGENEQAVPYFLQAAELFEDMGLDDYAERHRRAAEGDS